MSVSQVINGLLRLEQLELLDHMPSLCETQLVKQTKSLHSFLVHCVTSVTTQHAQERNVEMCLNCSPSRLDVDNDIIFAHDGDLLMELVGNDVITADQLSLRQGNFYSNNRIIECINYVIIMENAQPSFRISPIPLLMNFHSLFSTNHLLFNPISHS